MILYNDTVLINNCTKLKMDGWDRFPRICAECGRVVLLGYAPHWRYVDSAEHVWPAGQWECWHQLCWRKAWQGEGSAPVIGVPRQWQRFCWDFGPGLGGS